MFNHNINGFGGGVSQQPDAVRFDNQVESMVNFTITEADGLLRRNPLVDIGSTDALPYASLTATHAYSRGDGIRNNIISISDDGLLVSDLFFVGHENKTIYTVGTDPLSVWSKGPGTDWRKNLRFVTVGDTTWIIDTTQIVSASSPTTPTVTNKAFYWISRTFDQSTSDTLGYTYQVILNGVTYSANHESSISAASSLKTAIQAAGYTVKQSGSILRISRSTSFTFEFGDSWGNQASFGWQDKVSKIADLPADMSGFTEADVGTISIVGTDRDNFTNYYIKWNEDHWTETFSPGMDIQIDPLTMPAKLIQVSDDVFEFGFVDTFGSGDAPAAYTAQEDIDAFVARWSSGWEKRLKGDEDSAPVPSFVNSKISNMFFFKNRLGFTSEDNVILSESGFYYNFFPTTAMEIIDSDPIDAGVDSDTIAIIRNVNTTAGALTLWSDDAQFLLAGGEILSPATTRISQTSSYKSTSEIPPIAVDNEILFFYRNGGWLDTFSYNPASLQADKSSAEKISSHVPEYVPSSITRVVAASANNLVFFYSPATPTILYIYKYYIQGVERKISAWYKWEFDINIDDIAFVKGKLAVLYGSQNIATIDLGFKDINDTDFLDHGTTPYTSSVIMSRYNIQTGQKSKTIREPLYMKSMKVAKDGDVDMTITNDERLSNPTRTINTKFLNRKIFISGNSDKIAVGFSTNYNTGCAIDTVSIEGLINTKTQNA